MGIEEFVAKFIEQNEVALREVVFGFLGYATLAVAGIVYVLTGYASKEKDDTKNVPDTTMLLLCSFIFAAITCIILVTKFDSRKNFCIKWLPTIKGTYSVNDANKVPICLSPKDSSTQSDRDLIKKFCEEYNRFDTGGNLFEKIITAIEFLCVFFSIDFYVTAIRRMSLREPAAKTFLEYLCSRVQELKSK